LTLEQAADALGTSKMTVLRMISAGSLAARRACKERPGLSRPTVYSGRTCVRPYLRQVAARYQKTRSRFSLNVDNMAR
jgi:hypothetical protein